MGKTLADAKQTGLAALAEHLFAARAAQIAWFLAFALLTRVAVFGDTNFFHDELFYFQVGQRMHDGLLPYVDMWDRKGPGLFLTYYLIAGLSKSVVAYQAAAWLSASLTAWVVMAIARHFAGRLGAMLAGTLYLAVLPLFGGAAGQSPVFYNLWMALAGLAVVRGLPALDRGELPRGVIAGMASAGFALTFKQTAICESLFLGGYVLWRLHKAGVAPAGIVAKAVPMALAGALPMALFTAFFAATGHFAEFWHAMVTSNLTKTYNPGNDAGWRILGLLLLFSPMLVAAVWGLLLPDPDRRTPRGLLAGWLVAGAAGVAIVPNFFEHYMLPLAVPASVAAARALEYRLLGPVFATFSAFLLLSSGPSFKFAERRQSREALASLAAEIKARDATPKVLIFEGPVYLYTLLDSYPPSPIFYPFHLYFPPENDTGYLDTAGEVRRMLAWQPEFVIVFHKGDPRDENPETGALVRGYIKQCRLLFTRKLIEVYGPRDFDVYGECPR